MPNVKVNVEPRIDPLIKVNPACGRHREAPEPEAEKFHEELERETRKAWKAQAKKDAPDEAPKREEPKKEEASRKPRSFGRKKGKR